MSSFGFGSGFGASQASQSPFGSSPSPFGAPQSVFGQQQASFGGATGGGVFGASTSAFGATPTPAFGASSSAFGSSAFGARPSGGGFGSFGGGAIATGSSPFGASQSAFGAASTPAFGAQSSAGFGTPQPFGGAATPNPFGGGGFGASTASPAFGSSGFGATPAPAFGSTGFGTGFGQQPFGGQQTQGTRNVPFQKQAESEGGAGNTKTQVYFCTITAQPQFKGPQEKSVEELRYEDYQMGVKGNTGGAASPQAGAFGGQSAGFGGQAAASSPFGSFGQASTPAFGQASTPAFGQASSPAFGNAFQTGGFGATGSLFGKPAGTPTFGQSSSAFGGSSVFGATPTPAFGQSVSSFGSSTPTFGQSTPAFGGSTGFGSSFGSTPAFGAPQTASAFGGGLFQSAAASQPFAASTPATGFNFTPQQPSAAGFAFASTPGFGSTPSPQPFGASSSGFGFGGQASSSPSFGGLFNQSASKGFGSSFGASQPFGSTPMPFGAATGSSLFGTPASTPAFGGGSLFGGQQSTASSLFGFSQPTPNQQPASFQGPQQSPGVGSSPYGTLPAPPAVGSSGSDTIPEYRVGISQRPVNGLISERTLALMAPRNITPRSGMPFKPTATRSRTPRRLRDNPADSMQVESAGSSVNSANAFVARTNPRLFFVRDSLPSTESTLVSTPSAALKTRGAVEEPSVSSGGNGAGPSSSPALNGGTFRAPDSAHETPNQATQHLDSQAKFQAGNGTDKEASEKNDKRNRYMSDDEISRLLPKVTDPDCYIEPSLTQLAAMAREGSSSLANVANFKVGHRQHGYVQWKEDTVDVRGLDIDAVVQFHKGSLDVYRAKVQKPDRGEGLNKPAEITLMGVYRLDKATGRPTSDRAEIDKFAQRLKSTVAKQNARFVFYKPEGGIWRFQVEHFSRYGLLSDSEDENESTQTPQQAPPKSSNKQQPLAEDDDEGIVGMQEGDEEEGPFDDADQPMGDEEVEPLGLNATAERVAMSPVLAISLPAALDLEPTELESMRDSLFRPREGAPRRTKRRPAEGGSTPPREGTRKARVAAPPQQETQATDAHLTAREQRAPHSWTSKQDVAIQAPGKQRQHQHAAETGPEPMNKPWLAREATPPEPLPRNAVDAGVMMGNSFGVGWGPNNTFAHPGTLPGSRKQVSNLALKHLQMNTLLTEHPSPDTTAAMREHWQALLQVHAQSSSPGSLGDEEGQVVPQWSLKCTIGDLRFLCESFSATSLAHYAKAPAEKESRKDICRSSEKSIWDLVSIIYGDITLDQSSPSPAIHDGPHDEDGDAEDSGADLTMSEPNDEASEDDNCLLAFKRRACISKWCRDRSMDEVKEGPEGGLSPIRKIAILLSSWRLADAANVAAASGYARLATAIAQAGATAGGREDIAAQVKLWKHNGLDKNMDQELLEVYQFLSGDPAQLTQRLHLKWLQAFSLHLWVAAPADAPLRQAMESYLEATCGPSPSAPLPAPPYIEKLGRTPRPRNTADTAFMLLQLFTGKVSDENSADLAQLLDPEGHTPEPLDALLSWLLLQTLQAIGALKHTPAVVSQDLRVTGDLIAQLQTIGGLPEWEVYVALHLPTHHHPEALLARSQCVRELLHKNAPYWAEAPEKQDFLKKIGIPADWIAEALCIWARSLGRTSDELSFLLDSKQWSIAHQLLTTKLAPSWLLADPPQIQALQDSLEALQPHASIIDADLGSGTFSTGGLMYLSYLHLRELDESAQEGIHNSEFLDSVRRFSAQLEGAKAELGSKHLDTSICQVLAKMTEYAAELLATSEGHADSTDVLDKERTILRLPSLPADQRVAHLHSAAAVLSHYSA